MTFPAVAPALQNYEHVVALDEVNISDNDANATFDQDLMSNTIFDENLDRETAELVETELIPDNMWTRIPVESMQFFTLSTTIIRGH